MYRPPTCADHAMLAQEPVLFLKTYYRERISDYKKSSGIKLLNAG